MNKIYKNNLGYTLIELMIVVAIVGILASIAYPSYLEQVYKSKRAVASQSILECASILERRFTLNGTFTDDACDSMQVDDSDLTVKVAGLTRNNRDCTSNLKENCYLITATSQLTADTKCKTLTLNEQGVKNATPAGNTEVCWRSS